MKKLPILIIIPHGGYEIPEELKEITDLNRSILFIEADTCANEIFSFTNEATVINSEISRLFMDTDRPYSFVPPAYPDGVIKQETSSGTMIFPPDHFPDEIAIANLIRRYHEPFHQATDKIIKTDHIRLILECHTMMAVGPRKAPDAKQPRPLVSVQNVTFIRDRPHYTCENILADSMAGILRKNFSREEGTVANKFELNSPMSDGFILKNYGIGKIPMIRISISKALFLDDRYFDPATLTVKADRIDFLRDRILSSFIKFYEENIG